MILEEFHFSEDRGGQDSAETIFCRDAAARRRTPKPLGGVANCFK